MEAFGSIVAIGSRLFHSGNTHTRSREGWHSLLGIKPAQLRDNTKARI